MTLDRVRTVAALILLACLALPTYTCEGSGYVGPRGEIVSQVPDGADSAAYQRPREPHYAVEWMSRAPGVLVLLAFTWQGSCPARHTMSNTLARAVLIGL